MSTEHVTKHTCDMCGTTNTVPNGFPLETPEKWWFLQCTQDHRSVKTRTICPRCWFLFYARLFETEKPPEPIRVEVPVEVVKWKVRYRTKKR